MQALTTMLFAACGLLLVQGLAMLPAGVPQNYPMLGMKGVIADINSTQP